MEQKQQTALSFNSVHIHIYYYTVAKGDERIRKDDNDEYKNNANNKKQRNKEIWFKKVFSSSSSTSLKNGCWRYRMIVLMMMVNWAWNFFFDIKNCMRCDVVNEIRRKIRRRGIWKEANNDIVVTSKWELWWEKRDQEVVRIMQWISPSHFIFLSLTLPPFSLWWEKGEKVICEDFHCS